MAKHTDLGNKGEEIAADYLRRNGYAILARNYRYLKSEVDIIAKYNKIVVAVEVKTRSTADFGDPKDFLKPKQIQRLVVAMDNFMQTKDIDYDLRFDIISIISKNNQHKVEHIKDAFYHF